MKNYESEILKSLIKEQGVKNILRDGHGYELNKDVIKNSEELMQYLKHGLLVEVSTTVSNENIYDIVIYENYSEDGNIETNFEYSILSFKISRAEIEEI